MIIYFSGCGVLFPKANVDLEKACICVVETRGYNPYSALVFYDDDLNEAGSMPLLYASLGEIFYTPEVYNNDLYIVPQGNANKKDEKKVLRINLATLDIEKYTIDQYAINSIAVNEKYLYSANTLNGDSHISKCNKQNHSVSEFVIEQMYISKLICTDERLYAFGSFSEGILSDGFLYVFDTELNFLNKIDITKYGTGQFKAVIKDDKIYFSNCYGNSSQSLNTVGVYSISDNSIETIELKKYYPNDLLFYKGMLLVAQFDIVSRQGGGLSFYNLETKEMKYIDLDHGAEQMTIKGDCIYFLSDYKVYKYKLEGNDIVFEKMVEVQPLCEDYYYCSGLFSF